MLLQVILEGLGLGALLVLVCAAGIRKGAVGMVHLYPMGQPPAGVQPGVYAGLQRFERPIGQRLFPVSCKGRGQQDENADREDRIWRESMKHLHFDVELNSFYGAYWACAGGSDCAVIKMIGDDPEDRLAR